MKIGIPKERKDHEFRVALTPEGVDELVRNGHEVWVETMPGREWIFLMARIMPWELESPCRKKNSSTGLIWS